VKRVRVYTMAVVSALALVSCSNESENRQQLALNASSCMLCHNGSQTGEYSGPGIEDPHPFGTAANMSCVTCHGGNNQGEGVADSHVPPPPQIGDREFQDGNQPENRLAYFNRLTLTGIDKFPDYTVDGVTYSALDYLQFINPGDLRVTSDGRGCGQCHADHSETVETSMLATSDGVFSGAMFTIGAENAVPENRGLFQETAADLAFREVRDDDVDPAQVGAVARLFEFPVFSRFGVEGGDNIYRSDLYTAAGLEDDLNADGSVISGSPLANLFHEQTAFTCGDCHLGSAGANNRAGDFRSSGCTACHMRYSLGGRSGSGDPNVRTDEPLDPDDIDEPERAHVQRHMIRSVAKTLPSGELLTGIDDYTCAGCHQGSNRTVMQYWGIRLDQNQDLRNDVQYPANPVTWRGTHGDERLFDPVVGNNTFNGRNRNQYILEEDYDGDGRDDTPPDVHHEAGLGCIDCHGSYDLHGGNPGEPQILSRMEQAVAIRCESCHGAADAYAPTVSGENYAGETQDLAVDAKGNPLRHVQRESDGHYYLYSRLTGQRHYVTQTLDTIVENGRRNPFTNQEIYSPKASYAMGRDDGMASTGLGPQQNGVAGSGFSHGDNMSCASCHASWTNSCIGCHLEGEYSTNPNNFSNITGERIVFREDEADFVYQSPIPFQLGIGADNKIQPIIANTETFFLYEDRQNNRSRRFSFSDRNGMGSNTARSTHPALSHNVMMPHSIRGKVSEDNEGPRYCVACHLTDEGLATYAADYAQLRSAMASPTFAGLDLPLFQKLQTQIGLNPGNQLNSPLWVHMVAGLGTGLFMFDEFGAPVNPLDEDDDRHGAEGVAPADNFDLARVALNTDRIVDETGASQGSSTHPLLDPGMGPFLRDGALYPDLSGPLGATLIERLTDPTTGIVLNSWLDADGEPQGDAGPIID